MRKHGVDDDIIENDELDDLNQNIVYILEDIADDFNLPKSIIKIIYVVYLETTQDNKLNARMLDFVPKQVVKQVITELQTRLAEIM